jgi:hypothetical protein
MPVHAYAYSMPITPVKAGRGHGKKHARKQKPSGLARGKGKR